MSNKVLTENATIKEVFPDTINEFRNKLVLEDWDSAGVIMDSIYDVDDKACYVIFANTLVGLSTEPIDNPRDGSNIRVTINTLQNNKDVNYVGYTTKRVANSLTSLNPVLACKALFKCLNPNLLDNGIVHTTMTGFKLEECQLNIIEEDGLVEYIVTDVFNSVLVNIGHEVVFPCSVIQQVSTSVGGAEALYKNKPYDRLVIVNGDNVTQHSTTKNCGLNYVVTIKNLIGLKL